MIEPDSYFEQIAKKIDEEGPDPKTIARIQSMMEQLETVLSGHPLCYGISAVMLSLSTQVDRVLSQMDENDECEAADNFRQVWDQCAPFIALMLVIAESASEDG